MALQKTEARKLGKENRAQAGKGDTESITQIICDKLIDAIPHGAVSVHIYQSVNDELPTELIIQELQDFSFNVFVQPTTPDMPDQQFDVVVLPIVAADTHGMRVGYGGGSYDRFLEMQKSAKRIGICYDSQILDTIEEEPHDQKLDLIITERRLIST